MEKVEVLKNYVDLTTNMGCYDLCKRLINKAICGWDMVRQVNALVIKDAEENRFLAKVKPGCELIIGEEFLCISDKDFEHAWTRIEQIKVLGEIDVVNRYVLYEMPDIVIDKYVNGKFFIRELNVD